MSHKKILIAEISGKRPGGVKQRPTEKFDWNYDKVIISNNSNGYETDWPIVNVPDDYVKWYRENVKTSKSAWYAPMNRSYAMKYALEHGYDYLVQLDDNITQIEISYQTSKGMYRLNKHTVGREGIAKDMIDYMADFLENSNAGVVGMRVLASSIPNDDFIRERYVYSFFIMDLERTKFWYQGDFEDDIEYRLKLKQQSIPMICICPFAYGKVAQKSISDNTGNRAAYEAAGLKRGDTMSKLYGNYYRAGMSERGAALSYKDQAPEFRHKIKGFKVGCRLKNWKFLCERFSGILKKYATFVPDKLIVKKNTPIQKLSIRFKKDVQYLALEAVMQVAIRCGAEVGKEKNDFCYTLSIKNDDGSDYDLKEIVEHEMSLKKIARLVEVTEDAK